MRIPSFRVRALPVAVVLSLVLHFLVISIRSTDRLNLLQEVTKNRPPSTIHVTWEARQKRQPELESPKNMGDSAQPKHPSKTATHQTKNVTQPRPGSYVSLFPNKTESAHLALAIPHGPSEGQNSRPGQEVGGIISGPQALAVRELDLLITIPDQLRRLYRSGQAKLRLSRTKTKSWEITAYLGDSFYRALLYERCKLALRPRGPLEDFLERIAEDRLWIEIKYLRQINYEREVIKKEWRQTGNTLSLYVEEFELPAAAKIGGVMEGFNDQPAVGFDIIGVFKLAKDLIVDPTPEPFDRTMLSLKQSPAYSKPVINLR